MHKCFTFVPSTNRCLLCVYLKSASNRVILRMKLYSDRLRFFVLRGQGSNKAPGKAVCGAQERRPPCGCKCMWGSGGWSARWP